MNKDSDKTKEQLLAELDELRKKSKEQEDKLKASNQQLDANNQQLRATEQRLRANNQQLIASEKALKESELKFQKIIRESSAGISVANEVGKIIIWNNALEKITGIKKAQTIDRYIWDVQADLLDSETTGTKRKEEIKSSLLNVLKTGKAPWLNKAMERDYIHSDGTVKIISGSIYTIKTQKGYIAVSISNDITELKKEKFKLLESEKNFSDLVDNLMDGVAIADENAYHIYVNPRFSEITGYSKDKLMNMTGWDFTRPKDRAELKQRMKDRLAGKPIPMHYDRIIVQKNGTEVPVEMSTTTTIWQGKKRPMAIIRDITERKQVEEALKEREEKINSLFNGIHLPVFVHPFKSEGFNTFVEVNNIACQRYGYSREEFLKLSPKNISSLEDAQQKGSVEGRRRLEEEGRAIFEATHITKYGKRFPVEINSTIFNWAGQKVILSIAIDITERKQAEEKLKESEEKYRKIFENVQDIFYQVDTEGNIIEISPSIKRYSGYSREELIGTPVTRTYYSPNDRALFKAELEKKGEVVDYELRLKTKSEQLIYVSLNAHILYDENRNPAGIEGSLRDITERKLAEEALTSSEERLRILFESAPDAYYINDLKGNFIDGNKAAEKMLGYNREELIGKNFAKLNLLSSKDLPTALANLAMNVLGKSTGPKEFTLRRKDGVLVPCEIRTHPVKIAGKRVILGIARDITERKQRKEELTKLSTAVTQSPSVIAITDTDGKLEYVNPKFTEITGYSREELIGQNPSILQSGEHPVEKYKELWKTISSGKTWHSEFHNKKKNGELFWEMASISPIFDEQGKIIRYIKVADDITKQKRNEQIQNIIHNISNAVTKKDYLEEFIELVKNELATIIDTSNFYVAFYDEPTDSISLLYHKDKKDKIKTFPAGKTLTNYVIKTKKSLLATRDVEDKLARTGEVELLGADSKVWLGVPLLTKGKVSGVIAVQSYENEKAYGKSDMRTLEIISDQISLSIERIKAKQELAFKAEMLNQAPVIIAHHDLNHNLIWVNRKYLEFTGLTLAELKGKPCWQALNLEKPCNNCPVLKTLKTGEAAEDLLKPENQEHWPDTQGSWLIHSIPIKDKNGKVVGAIETGMDVTRQQQAEAMLKIELEKKLEEKTKELKEKISELERFFDATIDRELRMKELYDENEKLKEELKKRG